MVYSDIIFLQNSNANEALDILNNEGEDKAFEYLMRWYTNEEPIEEINGTPWGKCDNTYKKDNFVMSYNTSLGYIGLNEIFPEEGKL